MKKTRSTKRALLLSALSMLLCVSMLVGTTFAWFTDSVTSAGNKIQAGTLKVDLELLENGAWVSLKESKAPIFNYDKWEPGYTAVEVLKIENEGTLALKWLAKFTSEKTLSALADVIDVYVKTSVEEVPDKRDDIETWNKVGTVREFVNTIAETTNGSLTPKGTEGAVAYLGIALKMQETAGNEYQGLDLGGAFDIQILATQYTYEEDSFDDQYDAGLTPLEGDEVFVEENGIQYVYTPEGEAYLYLVTAGYAEDTVVVPEGITNIGNYAFAYNNNVKKVVLPSTMKSLGRGFDSSNVETVILNEGLEVIDSRAFRSTPNLKEVVISSTVKTIADNAFQKSGIKNIVIPATVETIGEAAFGSSMIESVTFEGNTSIQGYAFRGCSKLRTVHMEGDDVTFIPSTLNGRNSMWFCNGESNNPNTSDITFYVENDTVAARVKTAMGAEANNTPVYVNVADAASLSDALAGGNDVVMANDVTLTGKVITTNGITEAYGNKVGVAQYGGTLDGNGKSLTETGTNAYVIVTHGGTIKNIKIVGGGRGIVIYAPTEDVIIDNVVIDGPGYAINTAEHNGQDLIVTNSTVNGWTSLAGLDSVSFTNCKFGENSTKCWQNYGYSADYDRLIRPYGQASFTDCTFEKNFYIDLSSLANGNTVTLTDCICEGVELTAENYANYITVELPNWATSIADCIVFN